MIDHATLAAYIAIVFGFVFIPGPATLLTITRAASSGPKAGIATGAGIAAGDIVHTCMAIVGISAVIAASATLFSIIKYIGAGYLVFLGIRAILEKAPTTLMARGLPMPVAMAAGSIGDLLQRHPRVSKWQGRLVGCMYCALGVRLALEKR